MCCTHKMVQFRSDIRYSILGIKIADSASVMKHRPLLSIIQFVNRLSTVCFRVSTNFLPTSSAVGIYQVSTKICLMLEIFGFALIR